MIALVMKMLFREIPLALLLCVTLHAAASSPLTKDAMGRWLYDGTSFIAKSGEWNQAKNWSQNALPAKPLLRVNINSGSTVTLSKPVVEPISLLFFGAGKGKGASTFYLKQGGQLNVGGLWLPNANKPESHADFFMQGGQLTIGDIPEHRMALNVGYSMTTSGTARFTLSDGHLSVRHLLRIGSEVPNTNVGTLSIESSKPVADFNCAHKEGVRIYPSGTLEFILDADGVSAVQMEKSTLQFFSGSRLCIAGDAYTGGAKTIPLVKAGKIQDANLANIDIRGFRSPYTATVSIKAKTIVLEIKK